MEDYAWKESNAQFQLRAITPLKGSISMSNSRRTLKDDLSCSMRPISMYLRISCFVPNICCDRIGQ
jgi:hypothetical protein